MGKYLPTDDASLLYSSHICFAPLALLEFAPPVFSRATDSGVFTLDLPKVRLDLNCRAARECARNLQGLGCNLEILVSSLF